MKKIMSLLALLMMIVALTGCLDDPDGAKERPSSSSAGYSIK
jgi:predicted small lipoprotein YifL